MKPSFASLMQNYMATHALSFHHSFVEVASRHSFTLFQPFFFFKETTLSECCWIHKISQKPLNRPPGIYLQMGKSKSEVPAKLAFSLKVAITPERVDQKI